MKIDTILKNRIVWLLYIIAFLICTVVIAMYAFGNRDIRMEFLSEQGTFEFNANKEKIKEGSANEFIFENMSSIEIREIRIYGRVDTMYLKKISFGELSGYIRNVENGEMQWGESGLIFTGNEEIHLIVNDDFCQLLVRYSSSYLLERLILWGALFLVFALVLILVVGICEMTNENNRNNHGPIYEAKRFCADIKNYGQYMVYAAKTDLKAEVANSYLNRLWWLLEPFFNMIVYVVVFGQVMGSSVENYATFVFSALLMWNFFSRNINYSVKLVRNNKDIVTKVYIPKFILLLSNMILNIFKLVFSLTVLIVMMFVFKVHVGLNIFWVIPAYVVMFLLAFGVGMIFLHFGVYVDDLSYAVGILLNMLMFLSGIFYEVMSTLPEPLNTLMISLNPVAMFVDVMRNALLYNEVSNLPILGLWLLISVVLCGVGVHIVYKNENSYVKVV